VRPLPPLTQGLVRRKSPRSSQPADFRLNTETLSEHARTGFSTFLTPAFGQSRIETTPQDSEGQSALSIRVVSPRTPHHAGADSFRRKRGLGILVRPVFAGWFTSRQIGPDCTRFLNSTNGGNLTRLLPRSMPARMIATEGLTRKATARIWHGLEYRLPAEHMICQLSPIV
jgi:hypothetical protein